MSPKREPYYIVTDVRTGKTLHGTPSMALISRASGEAYYVGNSDGEGIWYLRDDRAGYTIEGHGASGEYRQVYIRRNPRYVDHPG